MTSAAGAGHPARIDTEAAGAAPPRPLGHPVRICSPGEPDRVVDATWRLDRRRQPPLLLVGEADAARLGIDPSPLEGVAAGLVALERGAARLEVIDTMGSEDGRDTTVKAWPTWGDLDDLIDVMDVRPVGPGRWVSAIRSDWNRPVVEGSQMLGQAVVAAGRLSPRRRVVSAHMVFMRVATTEEPLEFTSEVLQDGRTMTTLRVDVSQHGRCCATATLLLDVTSADVIRHAAAAPAVTGPYDCPPYDMGVTGRDIRVVDGAYDEDPGAPPADAVIDSWVRFRCLPDDPPLHAGLLAHFSGHMSISAALRAHPRVSQRDAHHSLSTGVNAIALSLHASVRADEWMLYHHRSTFAGDGMTHSQCRVHDAAGALLASFAADCMVRPMAAPGHIGGESVL